jgi:hypothetical protein
MDNMKKKQKWIKAQVFSMDMILGIIIFILIMAILAGIFFFGNFNKPIDTYNYEMDYLYKNLEVNVGQLNNNMIFIQNSRINVANLYNFANEIIMNRNQSIDDFVIGNISEARGIGLDPDAYDVCMYFTDNDRSIVMLNNGIRYLGKVDAGTCNDVIGSGNNPCDGYESAISMFKPVLFDVGNPRSNRIIQMNLVVCKR